MSRFVFLIVFLSLFFPAIAFAETSQKEVNSTSAASSILSEAPLPSSATLPKQSGMADEAIILWADAAASQIMTFNYKDYEQRFELAKSAYFNLEGFKKFSYTLAATEWFNPKAEYEQIVTATSNHSSRILKRHEVNGRDTIGLQVQLILTIRVGTKMIERICNVWLTVQHVPTEENAGGIAIVDWRADQR
jgi:Type-IV b secretion system, inner-membrane complex component